MEVFLSSERVGDVEEVIILEDRETTRGVIIPTMPTAHPLPQSQDVSF